MTNIPLSLEKKIVEGGRISSEDAKALWDADHDELLYHANRLRRRFKGDHINVCSILNAKSGRCSEDCRFCAQSAHHKTDVSEYPLVGSKEIEEALRRAKASGAGCFGIVTSGRALTPEETEALCSSLDALKESSIMIGASLGELDAATLRRLKDHGVRRFHHNLETGESFFPNICTTHSYAGRVATVRRAKEAGLEVCCGGLFGLGETRAHRVELAMTLRELDVDSVPMNFLNPVSGTPMASVPGLSCREILRTIAVFRFILPGKDLQLCGGREVNLRDLQSWIFYAGANGMMIGGYLTTNGRSVEQDLKMIEDLGLTIK